MNKYLVCIFALLCMRYINATENKGISLLILKGHTDQVNSANFNRAGTQVVTASSDCKARIWDASNGNVILVLKGHTGEVNSANFNRAGTQVVTASLDGEVRIWDAMSGQVIRVLNGHTSRVTSANFNRACNQVVTASLDSTARIRDAISGQVIRVLNGHANWIRSANFNRAGTRVVTASDDHEARIWKDEMIGKRMLALAMGLHARCGQKFTINVLPQNIVQQIAEIMRATQAFDAIESNTTAYSRIAAIVGSIGVGVATIAAIGFLIAKYARR